MKILLLALCVSASAAPLPPFPTTTVKRPAPLLSPKAASVPKSTPMFKPASVNPPLPMKAYYRLAKSEYGTHELTGEAKQPANSAVLFEVSPTLQSGSWVALAWYGPYPVEQQVFAALYSYEERLFIRATATPEPPAELRVAEASIVSTSGERMRVNPRFKGARVWATPKKK